MHVSGLRVVVSSVAEKVQRALDTVLELLASEALGADYLPSCAEFVGDPSLFEFQLFERHGPGIVCSEQRVALSFERRHCSLGALDVSVADGQDAVEVLHDLAPDDGDLIGGDGHRLPVGFDRLLDEVDGHGWLCAAVPEFLATHAVEIVVQVALAVAHDFDAE